MSLGLKEFKKEVERDSAIAKVGLTSCVKHFFDRIKWYRKSYLWYTNNFRENATCRNYKIAKFLIALYFRWYHHVYILYVQYISHYFMAYMLLSCSSTIASYSYCFRLTWTHFNSLAPGRFLWHFRWVIFLFILVTDDWCISCDIVIRWM